MEELKGLKVKIGLRQQGYMDMVRAMRKDHKTWEEIATVIGWEPNTLAQWYEWEQQSSIESLETALREYANPDNWILMQDTCGSGYETDGKLRDSGPLIAENALKEK